MLRKLGRFERALYLSDQHSPFNVVSVLRLENPPSPEILVAALETLQHRQPLMRARIENRAFEELPSPELNFEVRERLSDTCWLETVEHEMNERLRPTDGLFRGIYLFSAGRGELILTFHHACMDAASGVSLLDELLQACNGTAALPALELLPPVENRFPPEYKGWRGLAAALAYTARQMADEFGYRQQARGKRIPSVNLGGHGFPLTMTLPESLVDTLSRRGRQKKITLNSLLNAAQVLAANHLLYGGELTPMRTFTFADLRPYTTPPTSPVYLANYISMLRFTLQVSGEDDLWELASRLHDKILPSLKRGDKFIATRMSEPMMKMLLAMKSMRMGTAGLNYNGAVPLQTAYGDILVTSLHGFLSSFDIGPEVSSQARIFNEELIWDFMFLESDLGRGQAEQVLEEIRSILESAI